MVENTLYGRKLSLKIVCNPKSPSPGETDMILMEQDGFTPSPLRITFDVNYPGMEAFYVSEITIYNLAGDTEQKIIQEGAAVSLSAGYMNGPFDRIFSGFVFQPLFERMNVTDFKLTLRCIDGYKLFDDNMTTFSLEKGYTQMTLINAITARAQTPIPIGGITDNLPSVQYPRRAVIHGSPSQILRETLRWGGTKEPGNTQIFFKDNQLMISKLTDPVSEKEEITVISPGAGGLIGTPQQTDYGVSFRCLLNPNLVLTFPPRGVKLDMSTVVQRKAVQGTLVGMLDQSGVHKIIGVRHTGDTRGNTWYTDVTCVSAGGKIPSQLTLPGMLSSSSISGF